MNIVKKTLIAYYSRKGQNYVSGNIVELQVGNTEVVAKKIQAINQGDLFEIDTIKQYPIDYMETTQVARKELDNDVRPELTDVIDNMDDYDVVYLGFPNWYGTFPMAVFTFLESYDFSGKTIIPFCTHEGSGMGGLTDIQLLCPRVNVGKSIAIKGSSVHGADSLIKNWIANQKI